MGERLAWLHGNTGKCRVEVSKLYGLVKVEPVESWLKKGADKLGIDVTLEGRHDGNDMQLAKEIIPITMIRALALGKNFRFIIADENLDRTKDALSIRIIDADRLEPREQLHTYVYAYHLVCANDGSNKYLDYDLSGSSLSPILNQSGESTLRGYVGETWDNRRTMYLAEAWPCTSHDA